MGYAEALLASQVTEGLNAQRKLDGDLTISGPSDPGALQKLVSAGKRAEGQLRQSGHLSLLRGAYETAEVTYVGD